MKCVADVIVHHIKNVQQNVLGKLKNCNAKYKELVDQH